MYSPCPSLQSSSHPLIVHSHLRWDFVWQRPQQFLSRLSKQRPVLFCEAPQLQEENNEPYYTLHKDETFPNVTVMQTHFPASRFAAGDGVDAQRLELLQSALDEFDGEFANPIQWFYDPMAAPVFLGKLDEAAVVYDCMDELSQFKFAPPELIEREQMLLAAADVVFAGGRKMWQSKSRFNDNCHFYGCGVDIAHFGLARSRSTPIPGDIAHLRAPILGYFGVVDERMDYELVAALADDNPDWNIVIVGPTAKIDEHDLPRRTNLHWLGGRGYSTLPAYAKAFDVCLMPFALNEATEFINPTKALEYMATATPVVSTAVPDVVSNFSSALHIAHSHDEFIAQCRAALKEPDKILIESGLRLAQQNTWEAIVAKMEAHLADATASREYSQRAADLPHAPVSGDSVN